MAKSNVTQFAEELKLPVTLLLEQLQAAGVKKKAGEDAITEQDKTRLLDYLREMHGNKEEKKKITLTRKQTTEIKKSEGRGQAPGRARGAPGGGRGVQDQEGRRQEEG